MTRSELIKKISNDNPHLSNIEVEKMVKTIFDTITKSLSEGNRVELRGFGVFSLRQREARTSRNPRTGKAVQTAAKKVLHFRAGKKMAMTLNKG